MTHRDLPEADLAGALRAQPSLGLKLGEILIRMGSLSEDGLYEALAAQLGPTLLAADELLARSGEVHELVTSSGTPLEWFKRHRVAAWRRPGVFQRPCEGLVDSIAVGGGRGRGGG